MPSFATLWRVLVLAVLLFGVTARAEPLRLTMDEAVQRALETNPRVQAAKARANAAESTARSRFGRLLPAITVADEQRRYSNDVRAPVTTTELSAPATLSVRELNTNVFTVTAQQPVLGLIARSAEHEAAMSLADAAEREAKVVERDVEANVQRAFLDLFEARAVVAAAKQSQQLLSDEAARRGGDAARIEVARANVRYHELQAQARGSTARVTLLSALGLDPESEQVEFLEPTGLDVPTPIPPTEAATDFAEHRSPELTAALQLARAAGHASRAQTLRLLPDLDVQGAYAHTNGYGLVPQNVTYVGVRAQWTVWSWLSDWNQHKAASQLADAAQADAAEVRVRVRRDVVARVAEARTTNELFDLALAAQQKAEESFRLAVQADLSEFLLAEAALHQARLNLIHARFDRARAAVATRRAIGE